MTKQINTIKNLATESIVLLLIKLAIPSILSALVLSIYNVVDSVFVSRLNQDALTGMYMIAPVDLLLSALAMGTGIGTSSCVSRFLGEEDYRSAKKAGFNGLLCGVFVWLIFVIVGIILADNFISCFTDNHEVENYAMSYMKIICVGSLNVIISQVGVSILEGIGQMIIPMIVQITCVIINAILDPFLIFGIGIFPKLEVAGAAYSTIFSQFVSMVLILIILFSKKGAPANLSINDCIVDIKLIKNIFFVGIPASLTQIIGSIMTFFLNYIIGTYSSVAIAAYGIFNKVFSFMYMPVFGIVRAAFPILGHSIGAKNYNRFKQTIIYASIISGINMLVGTFLLWVFSEQIISLFNPSAELMEMTKNCFRIMSTTFVIIGISIPITTSFNAAGKSSTTLLLAFFRQIIVIIPLIYLLAKYINVNFVWWAFPISDVLNFILGVILFIGFLKQCKRAISNEK